MSEERNLIMRARAQRVCEYDYTTQAEDWTEDKLAQELADAIERLIRERDEARKLADYYASGFTEEAEARGYRRGVQDAATRALLECYDKETTETNTAFQHTGCPSHRRQQNKPATQTPLTWSDEMSDKLDELLKRSVEIVRNMTPAERAEMFRLQGESWLRGEAPCEHGNEWDECNECREQTSDSNRPHPGNGAVSKSET